MPIIFRRYWFSWCIAKKTASKKENYRFSTLLLQESDSRSKYGYRIGTFQVWVRRTLSCKFLPYLVMISIYGHPCACNRLLCPIIGVYFPIRSYLPPKRRAFVRSAAISNFYLLTAIRAYFWEYPRRLTSYFLMFWGYQKWSRANGFFLALSE